LHLNVRKFSVTFIFVYCLFIAYGNYTFSHRSASAFNNVENQWRSGVRNYFKGFNSKPVLLCMIGNSFDCKAHDLVADGVGPWWYSGKTNDGSSAYFFSTTNNSVRIPVVDSLMYSQNKASAVRILQLNNVTHLVVAKEFTTSMDTLVTTGIIRATQNRNIYLLK